MSSVSHLYTEIAHEDTLVPDAILPVQPRPEQVIKALGIIAGHLDLWEADPKLLATLDSYLAKAEPGEPHPLRNLKPYQPYAGPIQTAADVLRVGGPS